MYYGQLQVVESLLKAHVQSGLAHVVQCGSNTGLEVWFSASGFEVGRVWEMALLGHRILWRGRCGHLCKEVDWLLCLPIVWWEMGICVCFL